MKISNKLIISFLTVAFLISLTGIFAYTKSQKILKDSIGTNSVTLARETADKIDRYIFNKVDQLRIYSNDLLLQEFLAKSNKEFEAMDNIQEYIDMQDKEWISVPRGSTTSFIQRLKNSEVSEEMERIIGYYDSQKGNRVFGEIFITNKFGATVALTEKTSDYRQDDEQWWQLAKEKGLYVEDIGYDESAGIFSINICMRIEDNEGNFMGVMKAVVNIDEVTNILYELKNHASYRSLQFQLLDRKGAPLLAAEGGHHTPGTGSGTHLHFIPDERGFHILQGDDAHKAQLIAYSRSLGYKDFKGLGWVLALRYDVNEIFAPVVKLKYVLLIVSFVVTAFALLLGVIVSRSISAPIIKLKNRTREIGNGHLDTVIEIESKDEIGELADSFKTMVEDLKKSTTSISSLHQEIAERKKAEAELEKSHAQILQQEKMASIGQLSAGIAHEINNPTSFISSNLGTLGKYVDRIIEYMAEQSRAAELYADRTILDSLSQKKKNLKIDYIADDAGGLIKECKEGTDRIKGIVDGLKGFARVDESVRKPVDINQCLDSTLNIVWNELKYKCSVNKEFSALPLITCYPQQLSQVFVNLLVNASQAIEKQGDISIKTWSDNGSVCVSISDTGCGIPGEGLRRIFEPFYTTKEVGKGTGLGLSISYDIIHKHGGDLSVESEVGKGTTFYIKLPADAATA